MKFMGVILVEVVVEEGDEESEGGLRSGGHSPEAAPCPYKVIIDKDRGHDPTPINHGIRRAHEAKSKNLQSIAIGPGER